MTSFLNSPSLSHQTINIITRLRGPSNQNNSNIIKSKKSKSPLQKKTSERINSKSPLKKKLGGLNSEIKYTIFTCKEPSNTLIVSSKPVKGSSINETFFTKNDLYDFSQSILKETSLLEFDKVYNETHSLEKIYNDNIKDNITNLFHGKNSCVLFFGPIDSGKSFCLRGSSDQRNNENGILSKSINDIFNLIELTKQANQNSKIKNFFNVKISAYQIYLDSIYDLFSREINQIKLEQYYEDNLIKTNLVNLNQKLIKNKSEYDKSIQDAVRNRKNLSQFLKVNELKRKSHFIISLSIEKREINSDGLNRINNENLIENYSQIDFVELVSSNFGLINDINDNDLSMNGILYKNTSKVFNSISNNIVCASSNMTPKNESKLTLCLKNTLRVNCNIIFINCIIPWEYPLNNSYKALKFGNWIRNQVKNLSENDIMNNINQFSNNENDNNINMNNINNNNNLLNQMNSKNFQEDNLISHDIGNMDNNILYNDQNYIPKSVANNSVNMSGFVNDISNKSYNTMPNNFNEQITNLRTIPVNNNINYKNGNNKQIYKPLSPFSSNDENDIRELRDKVRRKYKSSDIINSNNPNQLRNFRNRNFNQINNYNNDDFTTPEQKIQNLENSLRQLEEKSFEMNQQLENIRNKRENNTLSTYQNRTISYLPDSEIEKIKVEHVTLKNDNIILREDMNRLVDTNKHLENELNIQRNRNIEIANDNERLTQEKIKLENQLKDKKK